MSLWIGDIQWNYEHNIGTLRDPVLGQIEQIECRDAILDEDAEGKPVAAEWPEAEFIVGNPPFLGMKKIREELGAAYAERLRDVYGGDLGRAPRPLRILARARTPPSRGSINRQSGPVGDKQHSAFVQPSRSGADPGDRRYLLRVQRRTLGQRWCGGPHRHRRPR